MTDITISLYNQAVLGRDNPEGRAAGSPERRKNMIKEMIARTRVKTGITTYIVTYESGARRELRHNDNWPMSVVKFFTSEDKSEQKIRS